MDGKSAEIWPLPEWEKREAQLAESSTLDDAVQKYLNLTSYYGQQVEMDNQARVLLPQILRGDGQAGRGSCGVWQDDLPGSAQPGDASKQNLPANDMTAEDRKAVAAILSRQQLND